MAKRLVLIGTGRKVHISRTLTDQQAWDRLVKRTTPYKAHGIRMLHRANNTREFVTWEPDDRRSTHDRWAYNYRPACVYCDWVGHAARRNQDDSFGFGIATQYNQHIKNLQALENVDDLDMTPVKLAEAKSAKAFYEGWIIHRHNIPDDVLKRRKTYTGSNRWLLDREKTNPWDNKETPYFWGAAWSDTRGWNCHWFRTREQAVASIKAKFEYHELHGKNVTWLDDPSAPGVAALNPSLAEAVAYLVQKTEGKQNIATLSSLLTEADEALAALTLLKQKLQGELQKQFTID